MPTRQTPRIASPRSVSGMPSSVEGTDSIMPLPPPVRSRHSTVPCSMRHDWRAVTTIKLGESDDAYPGDASVRSKTRSYCSESVDAWLGYPASYGYGYTWFGAREWAADNRRSVCWARTSA